MTSPPDPNISLAESRRDVATRRIEAETGIDEAMIARLVEAFYDRVRADVLIGPVFADRPWP
jgi:hemoglobin